MGFRSVFVTDYYPRHWPKWFIEKYKDHINVPEDGPLTPKHECKQYSTWENLPEDIQKAIVWDPNHGPFVLVYLHECGGITRVEIHQNKILYTEPDGWSRVDEPTHYYCHGCSSAGSAT